jgi:hypothetical protein
MRVLKADLEAAQEAVVRRPAYKILAFDKSLDSMSAIASGQATQTPFDLTAYCTNLTWSPDKLDFTLSDPDGLFHPDSGVHRAYLGDGAIVRLLEGDATVPETSWVYSFTGFIRGQIGWTKSRRSLTAMAQVSVFSRENNQALKRRSITSKKYTAGTELGIMVHDLLKTFLGLTDAEIRLPATLGLQFLHQVNQIAQMAPWDAITTLLQTVGQAPCFDGDGRLTSMNKNLHRQPDRVMPESTRIFDYQVPARNQDTINKVRVISLSAQLSRVDSPYQCLGTAQVTTGFFSMGEKLPVYWSEDRRQRAAETAMVVKKSVNSGLLPVGTESYMELDEFHGEIVVKIDAWVPILATLLTGEYLAAAFIPDNTAPGQKVIGTCPVAPGPVYAVTATPGSTIPWGRVLQAQSMISIMLIMMCMGSAQYEVWGIPYDYAYLELKATAIVDGLAYWEENEKEIRNDFLGSQDRVDALAMLELTWEVSNANPRNLLIADDLALERGDIIQMPDGRKFFITNLSKQIQRGVLPILSLQGFKVMTA